MLLFRAKTMGQGCKLGQQQWDLKTRREERGYKKYMYSIFGCSEGDF